MANKKCFIPKKVDAFLKKSGAKFELLNHKTVFTAYDKAATLKIHPKTIGKVLVVKLDKDLAAVVIPGNKNLNIEKLKKASKSKKADFVKEKAIKDSFKGIDPGAIPPFCELWGIKVYADKILMEQPKIILSAGSYEWSVRMSPFVFKKITPDLIIGTFSKTKEKKTKLKKGDKGKKGSVRPKKQK